MWLIDTTTFKLCHVSNVTKEAYAILSHTWNKSELSFLDVQDLSRAKLDERFGKIRSTCHIACSKKIKYAWIDTCCIDKSSSAELSEAINTMFRWYKLSQICYVYLDDFEPLPPSLQERDRISLVEARLRKCRWFTRGWTLQELIAPNNMEFFDRDWCFIGAKEDLGPLLSRITKVDLGVLENNSTLSSIPIGRKMAWAAGRETTREEDRAYSLLGIFDINMPLLYGEGEKAFTRLQQQIASEYSDLSLFAWQSESDVNNETTQFSGVFATSPDHFRHCYSLRQHGDQFHYVKEFAITNSGLRINANLLCKDPSSESNFLLDLDCIERSCRTEDKNQWLAIRITKVGSTFVRWQPQSVTTADSRNAWVSPSTAETSNVYIQTVIRPSDSHRIKSLLGTGIVIVYDDGMAEEVEARTGLPFKSCANNSDKNLFIFDAQGRDNFLAVHSFRVSQTSITVAIVCYLQWQGSSYKLRLGVFDAAELGIKLNRKNKRVDEEEALKTLKDMLLVKYSDSSGYLLQEEMPTRLMIARDLRLIIARPLRQLDANPQGALFTWRNDYHHVFIQANKVYRQNGMMVPPDGRWITQVWKP